MRFTTAQVVTAGTCRMVCEIDGLYQILNFLTGDELYTHQLLRASKVCEPWLRRQFPWLVVLDTDACNRGNWRQWLKVITDRVGEHQEVEPLPEGVWTYLDPVEEGIQMFGVDRLAVVQPPPT